MGRNIAMNQIAAFFDTMATEWDAICCHNPEKIRTILSLAEIRRGADILDVGCGTGILESFLLPYRPRQVTGIDLSPEMIARARAKYRDREDTLRFRCRDLMEIRDEAYDYLLIYSVYPHFPDPRKLIRHAAGLLRPGGKLVIAHSESKEQINRHHGQLAGGGISSVLPPAREVARLLEPYFRIEVTIDTEALYMVSGVTPFLR